MLMKNMSERNKNITAAMIALAGVGVCYMLAKYRADILQQIRLLRYFRDRLRHQQVHIVTNAEDCRKVVNILKSHCTEYKVLGFDCEWVTVGGARRPIALLQLASHRGMCALIRLCHLQRIPPELRELLEDDDIIKVGVAPSGDANYLAKDYSVCVASTLDLRFLAAQSKCKAGGLAKLSEEHLDVKLDKDWHIRCSDWEASVLEKVQIAYAAKDAHVAIELFKVFAEKLKPRPFWKNTQKYVDEIVNEHCFAYLDLHFKAIHTASISACSTSSNVKKNGSAMLSDKFQTRNISTRRKPLYYNCFLQAPDGELLCTCAKKKAMWYIEKDIGVLISDDPFTVRLKFEPAGRAVGETGKYYQTPKANQCVVCGEKEKYIRKNVVPREYRKYFPFVMKDHTSHDVLLLCPRCHQLSNGFDLIVREQLANECDAPLSSKEATRKIDVPRLRELKSISRALLFQRDRIPEHRLDELSKRFLELCPDEKEIRDDLVQSFINIETTEENDSYFAHGKKVVEYYKASCNGGLVALERLWRENFLRVMKPKYLPEFWSLEHNVQRLEIRADEGRVNEGDLQLAGISSQTKEPLLANNDEDGRYESDDTDSMVSQPGSDHSDQSLHILDIYDEIN